MVERSDPSVESVASIFPATRRPAALELGRGGPLLGSRGTDVITRADGTVVALPPPRRFVADETLFRGEATLRDAAPLVLDNSADTTEEKPDTVPVAPEAVVAAPASETNEASVAPDMPTIETPTEVPPNTGMRTLADVAGSLSSVADIETLIDRAGAVPAEGEITPSPTADDVVPPADTISSSVESAEPQDADADTGAASAAPSARAIEKIDLRGGVITTVGLSAQDVLDLSPTTGTLLIYGDGRNIIEIGAGWTKLGPSPAPQGESGDFTAYTQSVAGRDVTLLIEDGITVAR